jgi:hypothetical protein
MYISVTSILCYNGNKMDVILNYSALTIDSISLVMLLKYPPFSSFECLRYFSFYFIVLLFLFQINLCLIVGCSGISIVWSALCGFNAYSWVCISRLGIYDQFDYLPLHQVLGASLTFSISLWVYYAVVADGYAIL